MKKEGLGPEKPGGVQHHPLFKDHQLSKMKNANKVALLGNTAEMMPEMSVIEHTPTNHYSSSQRR